MLLSRPFIRYVAEETIRRIGKGSCQFKDPAKAVETFDGLILEAIALEEEINAEARELLQQYSDYMRANDIPYQQMFQRVKRQILDERKVIPATARDSADGKMKLSREKVTELSHKLAGKLPRLSGVRVLKGWNDVRLEIAQALTNVLALEQRADQRARQMIESQQRRIPEGSEEWTVLHRNYYEKEMQRLGVDLREPETPGV